MTNNNREVNSAKKIAKIVKKYLNITIQHIRYLIFDPEIKKVSRSLKPLLIRSQPQLVADCIETIADDLRVLTKN